MQWVWMEEEGMNDNQMIETECSAFYVGYF